MIAFFKYLKDCHREEGASLFPGASEGHVAAAAAAKAGTSQTEMVAEQMQPHHKERNVEQQPTTSATTQQPIPWFGFDEALTFVSQKGNNVVVQCNYCLPMIKHVRSAVSTSSNVKLHFKREHPEKLREILAVIGGGGRKRRRCRYSGQMVCVGGGDGSTTVEMAPKQMTFGSWAFGGEMVTQSILDSRLMDYIVEETVPLQTVDKPTFRALVGLGLPKDLHIMSAKTLRDQIEERAASVREALRNQMDAVAYVATTADCWASGKKTFLWVTAHWINPTTLKRECGALACKHLKEHHTYNVLAQALLEVFIEYGIHNKVVCITTDSGSNLAKVFQVSKAKDAVEIGDGGDDDDEDDGCDDDSQEEAEIEFVPISEILNAGYKMEKEATEDFISFSSCLPPHQRCASHTLSLVVMQDLEAMVSDSSKNSPLGPFRKHLLSLMRKCKKLWSKLNQSVHVAQYIREQCGVHLKVPNNKTGWSSTFEALKQVSELLSTMPEKVDAVMNQCSLGKITKAERLVIQEYTEILGPLVRALDILQLEGNMFMGYLLPTLYGLDRKLQRLKKKAEPYVYCQPLLGAVHKAVRKQFAHLWEDKNLLLAACLHPLFKLDWLQGSECSINRSAMETLLKSELHDVIGRETDRPLEENQKLDNDDFFFDIKFERKKSTEDIVEEEIMTYLKIPNGEVLLTSLRGFPYIQQCFLKYNTGIPSSMAAERLCSTGSSVPALRKQALPDDLFEHLVLLRQNRTLSAL